MEEDDNPNDGNNNDDNSLLQSHHHGITGDMSSNNKIGNNNSSAGVAAGQKSKKNGSSLNTNFSNTQTAATNFPYSPSQFFTEDASIIGRFFSGMTGGDATTTGAASAKNCKIPNAATAPEGFQRTASFGSTSTMSTVTTTTGQSGLDRSLSSRKSGNVLSGIPLQKGDIHSSTFDAALVAGEVNDIGKEQVTWDQDEIDLWNSCSNNITPELSTKISASIPGTVSYADDRSGLGEGKEDHQQQVNSGNVCEEETDNNNWAIRRRRHHEWRKKQRQDWDALRRELFRGCLLFPRIQSLSCWIEASRASIDPSYQSQIMINYFIIYHNCNPIVTVKCLPTSQLSNNNTNDEAMHLRGKGKMAAPLEVL